MATRPDRAQQPRALNVAALCEQGATLQGEWPLASFSRLLPELAGASDEGVAWSASGRLRNSTGAAPQPWLALRVQAQLPLVCQRCLQPLLQPLDCAREFRFVRDEDEAEREDELAEEDVLALPARLDLLELVEDELILALPLVPRHEQCPQPLQAVAAAEPAPEPEEARPHPFAALAALRGAKTPPER